MAQYLMPNSATGSYQSPDQLSFPRGSESKDKISSGPALKSRQNSADIRECLDSIPPAGKTIHNSDMYRQNYAICDFSRKLIQVIKLHQLNSHEQPTKSLQRDTKNAFFVKEQVLCNPDKFADEEAQRNNQDYQSALLMQEYLQSYKSSPKYHEDHNSLEHLARIQIEKKVPLPAFAKAELAKLSQVESAKEKREKINYYQKLLQVKKQPKLKKIKQQQKTNKLLSPKAVREPYHSPAPNSHDGLSPNQDIKSPHASQARGAQRFQFGNSQQPVSQTEEKKKDLGPKPQIRAPTFMNDPKIKKKIQIGKPVFQREMRRDNNRQGYTKLLQKINETKLTLRQIKNGQTLFEKDMMKTNYANPYFLNTDMRGKLQKFISDSKPVIGGHPQINALEAMEQPLPIKELSETKNCKIWLPQGSIGFTTQFDSVDGHSDFKFNNRTINDLNSYRSRTLKESLPSPSKLGSYPSSIKEKPSPIAIEDSLFEQFDSQNMIGESFSQDVSTDLGKRQNFAAYQSFRIQPQSPDVGAAAVETQPTQQFSLAKTLQPGGFNHHLDNTFNGQIMSPIFKDNSIEDQNEMMIDESNFKAQAVLHPYSLIQRKPNESLLSQLQYPQSPAFINSNKPVPQPILVKVIDFCTQNNIPFTTEEDKFYKIKQYKNRFKSYKESLNECFETGRPSQYTVGSNLLGGSSQVPPSDKISNEFQDLQLYLPDAYAFFRDKKPLKKKRGSYNSQSTRNQNIQDRRVDSCRSEAFVKSDSTCEGGQTINQLLRSMPKSFADKLAKQASQEEVPQPIKRSKRTKSRVLSEQEKYDQTVRHVYQFGEHRKQKVLNDLQDQLYKPYYEGEPIPTIQFEESLKNTRKSIKPAMTKGRIDPIKSLFRTNRLVQTFSQKMNQKLIKILERYELDRPILMHDKLDIIWDKSPKPNYVDRQRKVTPSTTRANPAVENALGLNSALAEGSIASPTSQRLSKTPMNRNQNESKRENLFQNQRNTQLDHLMNDNVNQFAVKAKLGMRKVERSSLNSKQVGVYQRMLEYLKSRKQTYETPEMREITPYKKVEEPEREFMDAFRVVVQCGYIIEQTDFFELLEILRVSQRVLPTIHQRVQIVAFFTHVASLCGFDRDQTEEILTKPWVEEQSIMQQSSIMKNKTNIAGKSPIQNQISNTLPSFIKGDFGLNGGITQAAIDELDQSLISQIPMDNNEQ